MCASVTFDFVVYVESLGIYLFNYTATPGALCRLVRFRCSKHTFINIMYAYLEETLQASYYK